MMVLKSLVGNRLEIVNIYAYTAWNATQIQVAVWMLIISSHFIHLSVPSNSLSDIFITHILMNTLKLAILYFKNISKCASM
jgi:hypothetical protein